MSEKLPRAILFDLDDTLIDDSSGAEEAWLAAIEAEAAGLRGLDLMEVAGLVQEVRAWFWSDVERHRTGRGDLRAASAWIIGEVLSRLGHADPQLAHRIAERYRDLREASSSLLPGAIETLERVKELGIAAALLTNGGSIAQRAKLVRFDLARYFDYVCIEGEYGCGKPDERVYRGALEALNCLPVDAWMVGDNLEWDVAAPMRLGITGIWNDRFKAGLPEPRLVQPERIVYGVEELIPG